MPAEIALEQSTVLPPPTARIKSISFSLQSCIPLLTVDTRGLGSTPDNSKYEISFSLKSAMTVS